MSDDATVQLWCVVAALAWLVLGFGIALKRRDGLHPGAIFCILFAWNYPLKLIATTLGFAVLNSSLLGAEWQLRALGLANLSAAMFVLPIVFGAKPPRTRDDGGGTAEHDKASGFGWLLAALVLIILSYGFYAVRNAFSFDVLAELNEQRGQARTFSAAAAIVRDAGIFCLITHFGLVMRRWQRLGTPKRVSYLVTWSFTAYVFLGISASKYMGLLPFAAGVLVANALRIERTGRGFALSRA